MMTLGCTELSVIHSAYLQLSIRPDDPMQIDAKKGISVTDMSQPKAVAT